MVSQLLRQWQKLPRRNLLFLESGLQLSLNCKIPFFQSVHGASTVVVSKGLKQAYRGQKGGREMTLHLRKNIRYFTETLRKNDS